MVMLIVVLLLLIVKPEAVQLAVLKLSFCCKTKPVAGDGHETTTVLPE